MLPGFRFLLAAILLSTSILVFGLGAAALLRATHEQYVSNPSWRNGPQEQVFAQASEPAQPALAALVAEPVTSKSEPSVRDRIPTIGLPVSEGEQVAAATTEADVQLDLAAPPAEAEAAEPAKAETATEAAVPPPADTLTPADTTASVPEVTPAATAIASEPAPVDPGLSQASSGLDIAAAEVTTLSARATTAWKDPPAKANADSNKAGTAKAERSKPESKAAKARAQRAKKQRRIDIVRRPPPQQLQQGFYPFGPQQTFATTAARARQ